MMHTEIPILIAGVGSAGTGREIMKALKISTQKYKIIATDMKNNSLGLFDTAYRYVVPPASSEKYIISLLDICKKENVKIIIPGSDIELEKISQNFNIFAENNIQVLANPRKVIKLCSDKFELANFLNKKGIICPKHLLYENEKDVDEIGTFPLIIKPKSGGGSKNVFLAQDKQETIFFANYLKKYNAEPIIQEYVGNHEEEYTIGILYADKGKLLTSIAMKRLLTGGLSTKQTMIIPKTKKKYVISSGISQGFIDDFKDIRKMAEKIARILEADGPINVQCRKTDQGIIPFEINPRFSGTTNARALLGHNEPDMLCKFRLFGETPQKIEHKFGYVIRDLTEKYISLEDCERVPRL